MGEEARDRRLNQIEHWRRAVIRLARQSDPKEWQDLQNLCDFLWEIQGDGLNERREMIEAAGTAWFRQELYSLIQKAHQQGMSVEIEAEEDAHSRCYTVRIGRAFTKAVFQPAAGRDGCMGALKDDHDEESRSE